MLWLPLIIVGAVIVGVISYRSSKGIHIGGIENSIGMAGFAFVFLGFIALVWGIGPPLLTS